MKNLSKSAPGKVRDAILNVFEQAPGALSVQEITDGVQRQLGPTPQSSVRSYLRLNTPEVFVREERGQYSCRTSRYQGIQRQLPESNEDLASFQSGNATLYHGDCLDWLEQQSGNCIHGVVTDPPYGLQEYTPEQQSKLRKGHGGVWRLPPNFDGHQRAPLPRFTTLTGQQLDELGAFFVHFGRLLLPRLVPGAHVVIASSPLLSYVISNALADAGLERRGEIARLVMTMRGGDRPKNAHKEFEDVTVMPRSMWEPWLVYRKPLEGRVQDNLRKWGTGGFRRPSKDRPFGDVIKSAPTHKKERSIAPHPSLKPQAFLRQVVRAILPLGEGVVLDPFAGAGSTLAAAEAIGYESIGVEKDKNYYDIACNAIPKLARLKVD